MKLELITPNISFQESYKAYITELGNEEKYPYPMDFDCSDFPALIKKLANYSKGINLPHWQVSNSTYWLVQNNELIGVSHLRHHLNEMLLKSGGHIGLGIRPSYRAMGYGNLLLELTIKKAEEMGIRDVHIHCHKRNTASVQMILSNGGVLDSEITETNNDEIIQRYIIKQEPTINQI